MGYQGLPAERRFDSSLTGSMRGSLQSHAHLSGPSSALFAGLMIGQATISPG